MKRLILMFFIIANFINPMGTYFIEEFENNSNKWYVSKSSREEIVIKDGNYIIKNLDENTDLSVTTTRNFKDFFVLEYRMKALEKEQALYGIFIELDSSDKFYLIFGNNNIAYFYEKDKNISLIEDFEEFPFMEKDDYNSVVLIKEDNNFTFLINEIPTERIWTIRQSNIKKVGLYLNNATTILLDRYTEFTI